MKMRRALSKCLTCIIVCSLLAGCGKEAATEDNSAEVTQETSGSIIELTPADTPDSSEDTQDSSEKAEDMSETLPDSSDDKEASTAYDFAGAFREKQVCNNGNYFVRIGDKAYFRNISRDSLDEGATFGDFLHTEICSDPSPLICYDMNTCEWEEIGRITGDGKLYACPEGFYIGETDPDDYYNNSINLYDPATGESHLYCKGSPLGISDSGQILAVDRLVGQTIHTILIKNSEEIADLSGENIYYEYVCFAGETLITILHTANDEYVLCSVDESGDITQLGMIGDSSLGYSEPKQNKFVNGYVYISLGYFEGTGHFLSRWEVIKAKPGAKGSLERALDSDSDNTSYTYEGEGPEPDVPIFFFDETETIDCSEHIPYVAYMGDGDKENDLLYYDDIFDECILVRDFIDRSDYENCAIIQDMESITETAFVIYADAEADPEYDIGWRMGYRMTGWHICAIPFDSDHLDSNGLAEKIIYF